MEAREKVYVVDDDQAMRDALKVLLEMAGYTVASFSSAETFIDSCTPECQGCIVLDLNMPGMGGMALQETLRGRNITLPAVFLTGYGTIPAAVKAMRNGAMDFLTKPVDGKVLLKCVADAMAKGREMHAHTSDARAISARLEQLTPREREIVELIGEGHTSKEIGQVLNISYRTVDVHRRHLMHKLGTSSNLEVARLLFQSTSTPKPQQG